MKKYFRKIILYFRHTSQSGMFCLRWFQYRQRSSRKQADEILGQTSIRRYCTAKCHCHCRSDGRAELLCQASGRPCGEWYFHATFTTYPLFFPCMSDGKSRGEFSPTMHQFFRFFLTICCLFSTKISW